MSDNNDLYIAGSPAETCFSECEYIVPGADMCTSVDVDRRVVSYRPFDCHKDNCICGYLPRYRLIEISPESAALRFDVLILAESKNIIDPAGSVVGRAVLFSGAKTVLYSIGGLWYTEV